MTAFLAEILAFPTVLFTILLGVVLCYWVLVIVGALDFDFLHHSHDVDLDVGHDLDLDVGHVHVDGLHGHADVGHDVDVDGDLDVDADADVHVHGAGFAGVMHAFGLVGVPITVSMSLVILMGWILCYLGMHYLRGVVVGAMASAVFVGVPLVALVAGAWIAGRAVQPLRPLFETHVAPTKLDLVGRICTVMTGSVTDRFGQAKLEDEGADHIVQVRTRSGETFGRGQRAVLSEWDAEKDAFYIAHVDVIT